MVDLHQWDRNKRSNGTAFEWLDDNDERPDFLKVRSMANLIGQGLKSPSMHYYTQDNPQQELRNIQRFKPFQELTRITDKGGYEQTN